MAEGKSITFHISGKEQPSSLSRVSKVVETVIKRPHSFEGSQLQLRRFIPDDPPSVFQRVTARVNFGRFQLSPQESRNALKVLKDKTTVEYREVSCKECVLSGTFNQIEAAHKLLQNLSSDARQSRNQKE
ncbi:hypothetical protein OS493_005099 [Desmophyllum pertusum]|uniref:Uncharacterized protein n=1 Tax=Desmophyllum pertusum TaxID=174260 RepID=A0A9W9Z476_9CNID|nr:hypothetical protein OS493_005099 [Desmophyllum pertusum]